MKSENSQEPTQDPHDMIFYTGRYEMNPSEVVHHIMNSAGADFFGKDLRRTFKFEGDDKLLLSGRGKNGKTVRMLWERVR